MKNILKDSNKYRNDINDILNEVFKYLPKLKDWYLEQSVIFDDNKKVLFKALRNDQNEKIGNQIIIDILLDTIYNYNLIIQDDSVKLTKIYQEKDKLIKETKKITINDDEITRKCVLNVNNCKTKYEETYSFKDDESIISINDSYIKDTCDKSLDEIIKKMKNIKNKTLVRK